VLPRPVRMLVAIAASVLFVVGSGGTASADPGVGGPTFVVGRDNAIMNFNSWTCLVARGAASDAPVVSTPCARYADQIWYARRPAGEAHRVQLVNRSSGKCLTARSSGANAYKAVQTSCAWRYSDQRWYIGEVPRQGGTAYALINDNSDRCLILQNGHISGRQAVVGTCAPQYDDQLWLPWAASELPQP
jgi:hypothetical protein